MSYYKPRKQKFNAKKSGASIIKERMKKFLELVEHAGTFKDIDLQIVMDLGDGQYGRLKLAVKSKYSALVKWHKKTRVWEWIEVIPEKYTTEQVNAKPLEDVTIE